MKATSFATLAARFLFVACMVLASLAAPAEAASKKVNVLMLLSDDAGMDQLRLYGYNSYLPAPPTPNLAALQTAGLTFRKPPQASAKTTRASTRTVMCPVPPMAAMTAVHATVHRERANTCQPFPVRRTRPAACAVMMAASLFPKRPACRRRHRT
jgi:hypothetical protein